MLTMFKWISSYKLLFIDNLMKCQFLLVSCCSVFADLSHLSLEILEIISNLPFTVLNLPFFKYKNTLIPLFSGTAEFSGNERSAGILHLLIRGIPPPLTAKTIDFQ